jgi:chromosome segregation ATPase
MTSALKQAGGDFGSGLETAANRLEAVSGRMAAQTEEAVAAVKRGPIDETTSIAQRVAQSAVDAGEESRAKVVGAGSDLAETVSGMGQQLTAAVNAIQDGLMGAVREMQNIERSIGQHVAAMNQLSKATQDAEGAMTRSAQSMRDAGAPLTETSRQMADASRRIADATASAERSISGAQAEIREISQLLHTTMETTTQQWRDYEQRFKGVDDSLGVVLDRIIQSVQENLEALRSFVERIDEKLSGAVDKLGGGIDELGEFAQSMEQLTIKLNGGGNDMQRTR